MIPELSPGNPSPRLAPPDLDPHSPRLSLPCVGWSLVWRRAGARGSLARRARDQAGVSQALGLPLRRLRGVVGGPVGATPVIAVDPATAEAPGEPAGPPGRGRLLAHSAL